MTTPPFRELVRENTELRQRVRDLELQLRGQRDDADDLAKARMQLQQWESREAILAHAGSQAISHFETTAHVALSGIATRTADELAADLTDLAEAGVPLLGIVNKLGKPF